MQKTLTPALIDRLKRHCLDLCRKGKCTMECECGGMSFGYCRDVWQAVKDAKKNSK